MRAVIQRVDRAEVRIGERIFSRIGTGLLVLLGIERGDGEKDADDLSEKIVQLRIFDDEAGRMNLSLLDVCGEILVVSQFTLLADCRKGRRPSFTGAEDPGPARTLYDRFIARVEGKGVRVACGEFQALMRIELVNHGPVTILLDSRRNL